MASEREYLEKMSTALLDMLLSQEAFGSTRMSLRSIYLVCEILARREPARGTTRDIFLEFARQYADNKLASEE